MIKRDLRAMKMYQKENHASLFSVNRNIFLVFIYIYIYTYCSLISEEEILDSFKLKTGNSWLSSVA